MEYRARLDFSGKLERGETTRGIFQICKNDAVRFAVPVSLAELQVGEEIFQRPADSDVYWEVRHVFTECGSVAVRSEIACTWIVVSPVSDKLTIQTVLPRRLGPLKSWIGNLSGNFAAFHFPPVQTPGESLSCYSISDHFDVDAAIFGPDAPQTKEQRRQVFFGEIGKLSGKFLVTDVVLNHVASSSPLLDAHPEIGYTRKSAPHLQAAFELEQQLVKFERKFRGEEISDEQSLLRTMEEVREEVVNNFRVHEYFLIDLVQSVKNFRSPGGGAGVALLDQALCACGVARKAFALDGRGLFGTEAEFIAELKICQSRLEQEAEYTKREIVSSLTGYFRYHCVVLGEKKLRFPRYFTTRGSEYFANNGWVMGWPAEKDFAGPGNFVYLRRQLVCWGDCVKLNYGTSEASNPLLWEHMTKYCVEQATHFQGVRLDNAHATCPEFLRHVLQAMRTQNKDLFVMAELFSGDQRADELFVEKLGISALVRELIQVESVHDIVFNLWRLGCRDAGSLDTVLEKPLLPTPPRAVFYDCTHDNPTPAEKFHRPSDALGLAAVAAAAPCLAGTVRGFDDLLPVNVSVVPDGRLYLSEAAPAASGELCWPGDVHATKVEVYGSWDAWKTPILLTRDARRGLWSCSRPKQVTANSEFKFVVDGTWRVNPLMPACMHPDGAVNNLFVPSPIRGLAFKDVRAKLATLAELSGFTECYFEAFARQGCVFIRRFNPATLASIVFLVKFAFAPCETSDPIELSLESEIEEVLLDCSLRVFAEEPPVTDGLADTLLQGYAHAVTQNRSISFPDSDLTKIRCHFPPNSSSVLVFRTKSIAVSAAVPELPSQAVSCLSLAQLNRVLFQCDAEERVRTRTDGTQGVYEVPNHGSLVYAGVQGVVSVFDRIRDQPGHLGHPLCENVRGGDWLLEYHVRRLREFPELAAWLQTALVDVVRQTPRSLKPAVVDRVFRRLHAALVARVQTLTNLQTGGELAGRLVLASVQFVDERVSLAAGLPHFSSGYMRSWGRDTFIALPGLLLIPGRFEEAAAVLTQFARLERFGLIPNLSDSPSFANPRYNCRDATWWFARAWVLWERLSGRSLPEVEAVVVRMLDRHWSGISFREPRAGREIDAHMTDEGFTVEVFVDKATGLIHGGNEKNCGTWMDKMGSSQLAGNDGVPATSRDGAAVEVNAAALYVLEYLSSRHGRFVQWRDLLGENFETQFWSEDLQMYKDVVGAKRRSQETKFRPNAGLSLAIVPEKYVDRRHAKLHLQKTVEKLLDGPLGAKTLDKEDPDYRGYYESGDSRDFATSCGFNYHNGPEWLWPVGLIYAACTSFHVLSRQQVLARLQPHLLYLMRDEWKSLPELTNANGVHCQGSCAAQAWSVATLIELLVRNL